MTKALWLLAAASTLTACGGKSETAARPVGTPISCLSDAGLTSITARGANTWRGFHGSPFFDVFVDRLATPAAAAKLVNDADLVIAVQAGRYAVTGPSLETDDDGVVASVAVCLGG